MKLAPASMVQAAKGRLLPLSIPFRFFVAASLFQVTAWGLVAFDPGAVAVHRGGFGVALGALHALTLGVLLMVAIGASLQLLPVATGQPLGSVPAARAIFWLYVPGAALLVVAMTLGHPLALNVGAASTALGLALYVWVLATSLRGARGLRTVVIHAATAASALVVAVIAGSLLAIRYALPFAAPIDALVVVHVASAVFGVMSVLAAGFSYLLVPMFAVADEPSPQRAQTALFLAVVAVIATSFRGIFTDSGLAGDALLAVAALSAIGASALHLVLVRRMLAGAMRPDLGPAFRLVRLGWTLLPVAVLAGIGALAQSERNAVAAAFVTLACAGYLLSFVLGILERILPFLASVHGARPGRRAPMPSALTPERAQSIHWPLHVLAVGLLVAGIAFGHEGIVRAAGVAGVGAALAFAGFVGGVLRRLAALLVGAPARVSPSSRG